LTTPLGKGALAPLAAPLQPGNTFPPELVAVGGRFAAQADHKRYLGKAEKVTQHRLDEAARFLGEFAFC
jgi:hypothetical protein